MGNTTVVVADGQALYCEGIAALLKENAGFDIAGTASNGKELIKTAEDLSPDVILLDAALPPTSGLECVKELRSNAGSSKILVLTEQESELDILSGFRAGVNGFLSKKSSYSDLVSAINSVSRGDFVVHISIDATTMHEYFDDSTQGQGTSGPDRLTRREREIVKLVGAGTRTAEIAQRLQIAPKTVSGHRANIMKKLGVHSQTELVKFAILRHMV